MTDVVLQALWQWGPVVFVIILSERRIRKLSLEHQRQVEQLVNVVHKMLPPGKPFEPPETPGVTYEDPPVLNASEPPAPLPVAKVHQR